MENCEISTEDKIFVRNHFTDFEKLLFAEAEIRELKRELSLLKAENLKLSTCVKGFESMLELAKGDLKQFKKDHHFDLMHKQLEQARNRANQFQKENQKLIGRITQANLNDRTKTI